MNPRAALHGRLLCALVQLEIGKRADGDHDQIDAAAQDGFGVFAHPLDGGGLHDDIGF